MGKFLSPEFLKVFLPLIGGIIAWFINEWRKRSIVEYRRKEERYQELIKAVKGFYAESASGELKQQFLDQINLCWLYCPDDVIEKAYRFLSTVHTDAKCSEVQKEEALGSLIVSIRKDLLSRKIVRQTSLSSSDFKHFFVI